MTAINDQEVHQRVVYANVDESDIRKLLVEYVAKQSGIKINPDTKVKCHISKKSGGIDPNDNDYYATIEIVNDLKGA